MIFITESKNNFECKRITHDFPDVKIFEITENDLFKKIDVKESVYLDWRLKSNDIALFLHDLNGIEFLERKGGRYFIY